MNSSFFSSLFEVHCLNSPIPSLALLYNRLERLFMHMFSEFSDRQGQHGVEFDLDFLNIDFKLHRILHSFPLTLNIRSEELDLPFLKELPSIHKKLHWDAETNGKGHPAAHSKPSYWKILAI